MIKNTVTYHKEYGNVSLSLPNAHYFHIEYLDASYPTVKIDITVDEAKELRDRLTALLKRIPKEKLNEI